jgi:hypothetical protein
MTETHSRVTLRLLLTFFLLPILIAYAQAEAPRLTNTEVLEMTRAQISADIIVAKIKVSRCNFSTEPTVLAELKRNGVPDAVLLAMVQAPYGPPVESKSTPEPLAPRVESPRVQAFNPEDKIRTFRNHKRFSVSYDKFKDRSSIDVGPFVVGGNMRYALSGSQLYMTARFLYPGQILREPVSSFALWFQASGQNWEFLKSRHLYALIEGERFDLGEGIYDGDVRRQGVSETLAFIIPAEVFKKLGTGSVVELRIGQVEMALKDEHQEAFRDLYGLSQIP